MTLPIGKPSLAELLIESHSRIAEAALNLKQMRGAIEHTLFQIDQQEAQLLQMLKDIEAAKPDEERETA